MNFLRHLRRWLLAAALLLVVVLAMFQPTFSGTANTADFAWPSIFLRFGLYAFGWSGLWLLLFLPGILRWLFTWRTFKWTLRLFTAFAFLVLLFYLEEDWRGKHDWDNYRRAWEAKGEKFDFASFIPPPVPDDQNFALTPIVASCYSRYLDKNGHRLRPENTNVINQLDMKIGCKRDHLGGTNELGSWPICRKINLSGWQRFYRIPPGDIDSDTPELNEFQTSSNPQTPAADVLLALSKYDSAVEELRQTANRFPKSRFPLNYEDACPATLMLPHHFTFEDCGWVLELRAAAELQDHHNEKALSDIELILRLSNSIQNEPCIYSQFAHTSLIMDALQPIWEGLADRRWSDAQLGELDQYLGGFNLQTEYVFGLRSTRASDIATIEFMRTHRAQAWNCIPIIFHLWREDTYEPPDYDYTIGLQHLLRQLVASLVPSGWFYWSEMNIGRMFQPTFPTKSDNETELIAAAHNAESLKEFEHPHPTRRNTLALMVCPYFGRLAERFIEVQSSLDLARVACALERYNLAHGRYPENLDSLAPQFIKSVPKDIINDQPLHYRLTRDGRYQIYSVGWNGQDDGGIPGLYESGSFDYQKGDLVWQYSVPASSKVRSH